MCIAGLTLALSCSEDFRLGQPPVDSIPPSPLSNVNVTPMPGGARITYEIPKETDISYVKGEFLFQNTKKVVRASVYDDFLIVEGLGSVEPVDITLFVVDHSENVSTPVLKTFIPETPPLKTLYTSLELAPDFAGINLKWDNPLAIEIGITLFVADSFGVMQKAGTKFFDIRQGNYSFRGFDAVENRFGVSFSDRWGNLSDTTYVVLTPLFEKQLDRSKHRQLIMPFDNTTTFSSSTGFEKLFDGVKNGNNNFWHTREGDATILIPYHFTLDLGMNATLSRFMLWNRVTGNWEYILHNLKEFEVWATSSYRQSMPDEYWQGDDWKSDWKYLGYFITQKPSGNDNTTVTAEDLTVARAGYEFYIPLETGTVRYLRFAVNKTWGNTNATSIQELEFFGDDRE
jgi:hypothetical protein